MHCVPCDDKFLIGGDEGDLYLRVRERDDGILAESLVGFVVELESEIGEVLADTAAETVVVLADTACEDDKVDAVHLSHELADILYDIESKFLEDKL